MQSSGISVNMIFKYYLHTYIHTLHTYIHIYIHTYLHTYTHIHTYIHTYIIHVYFIISHRKYYLYQWVQTMFNTNPSVFQNKICHNFVLSEHCKYKTCSSNYDLLTRLYSSAYWVNYNVLTQSSHWEIATAHHHPVHRHSHHPHLAVQKQCSG